MAHGHTSLTRTKLHAEKSKRPQPARCPLGVVVGLMDGPCRGLEAVEEGWSPWTQPRWLETLWPASDEPALPRHAAACCSGTLMTWQASPCRTQSRCPQMKPHAADSRVGGLASAGCDTHSCSISQRDSHHRVQRSRRPGSCDTADSRVVVAGGGREGAQWAGEAPPGEVQLQQGQKRAVLVVLGVLVGDAQLVAEARPGEVAQREKRALTGMQPQCLGEAACRFGRKNPLQHLGRPMVRR